MHYRALFWTYFLSTIVKLVVLTSNFVHSFHRNHSHNSMHINTACIRITLLVTLVIVSRNRLVFVSDLEEQSSRIASRSVNYGTLNPQSMPLISNPSDTIVLPVRLVTLVQFVKVGPQVASFIRVFGIHIWPSRDRYLQMLIGLCFGFLGFNLTNS